MVQQIQFTPIDIPVIWTEPTRLIENRWYANGNCPSCGKDDKLHNITIPSLLATSKVVECARCKVKWVDNE